MFSMFFFNAKESPAIFYALSGLTQFLFSGFNTAIYAIIPDCVEYGEWKTGLRNDGISSRLTRQRLFVAVLISAR